MISKQLLVLAIILDIFSSQESKLMFMKILEILFRVAHPSTTCTLSILGYTGRGLISSEPEDVKRM
jgi:hypothetical protein